MEQTSPAPALARGIALLEQLTQDGQQPLEQLAARNQWPKSSVLRCLKTLESLHLVEQDPGSRHWRALAKLTPLDSPRAVILRKCTEQLPGLAEQTGHCVELYEVQGRDVTLVDRTDPEGSQIVVQARIGSTRDLHELDATASVVFAYTPTPPPESLWYWSEGQPVPVPEGQPDRILYRVRENGVGIDHAFNQHGIRRFAVPLLEDDALVGILAVAQRLTPGFRADAERIQAVLHTFTPTPTLSPIS